MSFDLSTQPNDEIEKFPDKMNELETMDEMDDSVFPEDDKKWIIVHDRIDPKQFNDLLKEVEYLKSMVIEMHRLMVTQNENISRIGDNVGKMNENMVFVSKEIGFIRGGTNINLGKYTYVKDYLFPALRIAGTYTPFLMILTAKTGIASTTLSFLFSKIFS